MCAAPSFVEVAAPAGTRFGAIRRFTEIDSTNRYLLDEARAGAPEGTVAVADFQSAGRGRLGRRWEAPPGSNLLVSVLLRPTLAVDELHLCTVAVALAAAAACGRAASVVPDLKWPNDLMVGGRKLGGILAETVSAGAPDPGTAVVVGLGLNVGWPPPDGAADPVADAGANTMPAVVPAAPPTSPASSGTDDDASLAAGRARLLALSTSLRREAGGAVEPPTVLGLMLEELETRLVELAEAAGRRRLASEYRRRCVTVGKDVRVWLPGEDFTGTACDITAEGHLIVDVGTCFRTVVAGDVVHLRDGG